MITKPRLEETARLADEVRALCQIVLDGHEREAKMFAAAKAAHGDGAYHRCTSLANLPGWPDKRVAALKRRSMDLTRALADLRSRDR
jgi:hypothetical protein